MYQIMGKIYINCKYEYVYSSFFEHVSPESYFVILDPLNENNNTTKNSFLTHDIIKSFRKAFNSLKNALMQY